MPKKDLPRRELRDEPSKRASFDNFETSARARGIRNAEVAWGGVRKTALWPTVFSSQQMSEFSKRTRAAVDGMKSARGTVSVLGGERAAAAWTERMNWARGDLNGVWNDVKAEVAGRHAAEADRDPKVARLLDWLELAERDGGFGSWLDQWNDMLGASWSFDTVAESAERLKRLLDFHREAVASAFGELSGGKEDAQAVRARADLIGALDGIAAEIARQAEAVLGGNLRLDLGLPFDGLTVRLGDASPRRQMERRLERAFSNGRLEQAWVAELPQQVREGTEREPVATAMREWQTARQLMRELLEIDNYEESDAVGLARSLTAAGNKLARELSDLMREVGGPLNKTFDPDDAAHAMSVMATMAEQYAGAAKALSDQLSVLKARESLRGSATTLSKVRSDVPIPTNSIAGSVGEFIKHGNRLDAYWTQTKAYVDKKLREVPVAGSTPTPAEAAAIQAGKLLADTIATKLGTRLEDLLVRWTGRQPPDKVLIEEITSEDLTFAVRRRTMSPEELKEELERRVEQRTYRLGWELLATIRDLKVHADLTLEDRPRQRSDLVRALDTLTDTVRDQIHEQYGSN